MYSKNQNKKPTTIPGIPINPKHKLPDFLLLRRSPQNRREENSCVYSTTTLRSIYLSIYPRLLHSQRIFMVLMRSQMNMHASKCHCICPYISSLANLCRYLLHVHNTNKTKKDLQSDPTQRNFSCWGREACSVKGT